MATTYEPVIIGAALTPNPPQTGQRVLISVTAIDLEIVQTAQVITSGEFTSGEV